MPACFLMCCFPWRACGAAKSQGKPRLEPAHLPPFPFSLSLSFLPPDQELKLYDWCCNQAGSAHLCARYSEKRPKIGCDGYQSPSMGGFAAYVHWGDAVLVPRAGRGLGMSQPPCG